MSTFTTSSNTTPLRYFGAGLFALLLLAATAVPAQAQMDDGELPKIDFAVNVMQSAQYISLDAEGDPDPITGFHRNRAGLNASVQFSERVSALVMLEQEPNDFGGASGASQFQPQVDFLIMDLALNDQLTLRTGTPVTGLMNFRGFSDGPVVQGNPLIGNSPADMITAGTGVKLVGSYDAFGFDVTVNRGFGEDLTSAAGGNTGLNFIGKFRYTGSEVFKFGAGAAAATGTKNLVFASGDGENYNLSSGASAARNTHAAIPGETILHADGKITAGGADVDLWTGYGTASQNDVTSSAFFGGAGLKFDVSESFYIAGRFTFVSDQSDNIPDEASTSLTRIQGGFGVELYEKALFKVEAVQQSHGDTAVTRPAPADSFFGLLTELSFNF
jgi:hypothetical protein